MVRTAAIQRSEYYILPGHGDDHARIDPDAAEADNDAGPRVKDSRGDVRRCGVPERRLSV